MLHARASSPDFQRFKLKSGPVEGPLHKEARREGVFSGKAMQDDEVEADAKTLVVKKSNSLDS
jgi:hypothetical protein